MCGDESLRAGIEVGGRKVSDEEIGRVEEADAEVARVTELIRRPATRVRFAVQEASSQWFSRATAIAHSEPSRESARRVPGLVWFDAHADFDDPDENTSGFFDVTRAWRY